VNNKGFTLIELLVVIAIVGVLMGLVIAVINPATILYRSRQGVCKANVARTCEAVIACYTAMNDVTKCDDKDKVGVTLPTSPCSVTITSGTGVVSGTQDSCTFTCTPAGGMQTPTGTCYAK